MNHPKDEEWVAYLDGDAPPEAALRLAQHLEQCPQCATAINGWQESMAKLRRLSWPAPPAARRRLIPALRWAAAAGLVLFSGFAFGRFSGPSREEMRATVAAEFKAHNQAQAQQLSQEFARIVREARADDRQALAALAADFQQQRQADYLSLRKDLETLASAADAGLQRANRRLTEIAVTTQAIPNY